MKTLKNIFIILFFTICLFILAGFFTTTILVMFQMIPQQFSQDRCMVRGGHWDYLSDACSI